MNIIFRYMVVLHGVDRFAFLRILRTLNTVFGPGISAFVTACLPHFCWVIWHLIIDMQFMQNDISDKYIKHVVCFCRAVIFRAKYVTGGFTG